MIRVLNNIKNIRGWRSKNQRKIVVFSVDDFGNARIDSLSARTKLLSNQVKLKNRFDYLDSLENYKDLELLFNVLTSVKDLNGNSAKFTGYTVLNNINFENTLKEKHYVPLNISEFYKYVSGENQRYVNTFEKMLEGIDSGLFRPQFHGTEHLHIGLLNRQLIKNDWITLLNLENRCYTSIPDLVDSPTIKYNQTYSFWKNDELDEHRNNLEKGLKQFEILFGFVSQTFTAPAMQFHPTLEDILRDNGVIGIDKMRSNKVHIGNGQFKKFESTLGKENNRNVCLVRNCVFEPTVENVDWVNYTFNQIKAAFYWNKPAIISSHRVNFCSNVDENNRQIGLKSLERLLHKIVEQWPDVEFLFADELTNLINDDK
jgi:hypothetical protein